MKEFLLGFIGFCAGAASLAGFDYTQNVQRDFDLAVLRAKVEAVLPLCPQAFSSIVKKESDNRKENEHVQATK